MRLYAVYFGRMSSYLLHAETPLAAVEDAYDWRKGEQLVEIEARDTTTFAHWIVFEADRDFLSRTPFDVTEEGWDGWYVQRHADIWPVARFTIVDGKDAA